MYLISFHIYWHFFLLLLLTLVSRNQEWHLFWPPHWIFQPREQSPGESWGLKKMKRWFSYHFCISCKAILHTNTSPISHQGGLPAATKPREVNRLPLADCLAQASMWNNPNISQWHSAMAFHVGQICLWCSFSYSVCSLHTPKNKHTHPRIQAYTYTCRHIHTCTHKHTQMHTCTTL